MMENWDKIKLSLILSYIIIYDSNIILKTRVTFSLFKMTYSHNIRDSVAKSDPCVMYRVKEVSVFFSKR